LQPQTLQSGSAQPRQQKGSTLLKSFFLFRINVLLLILKIQTRQISISSYFMSFNSGTFLHSSAQLLSNIRPWLSQAAPRTASTLLLATWLLLLQGHMLFAQSNGEATENLRATLQANGQGILLQWWGKSGRTYFVQTSPTLNLGVDWSYEGHVLTGTGTLLSISLPAQPSPSFIRLRYTDQPVTGDPYEADPDQDGLSNREEIQTHGTNPLDPDSDDDGLPDGWEVQYGLSPLSAEGSHGAQGDPDGDTLKNLIEYQLGSSPINADTDGDVLPDWWEFRNQTSLISSLGQDGSTGDIDQDGYTNLEEFRVLSDPRNASSYPGSGGPRQEFGGTGTHTPDPSFATFLARRVRHMSFGSYQRYFRPAIMDWVTYYEQEVPNAHPPPSPHDNFNGDADVNGNTLDPGDPRDTPSSWEPTFWVYCEPDDPGAVMRKVLEVFQLNDSCDTPVEENRHSTYWITNAYPGDGGRLEVESSSLEFSRSTALAAMESLPIYQGSPEDGWMGAGRWGTFVSTVTSQWDYGFDTEDVISCYSSSGLVEETYPYYMSSATMEQEQVRYQCNQPAPTAQTKPFVLVKRQKALPEYGSHIEHAESVEVLGSMELRIEEGQMISSQASANFPLPEGVSLQGGTILLTSPPVDPGTMASYEAYPIDININDTADTKDAMVRKEQKIGTTAWRQWIPCTVKIPDSGPGKTIASIGITAENGTMKFSDAQAKPGDSDAGTSTVNLTLDSKGQGRFWITGITQSTHKGDAKLQIRKDGATGDVLATQPLTVFWFDASITFPYQSAAFLDGTLYGITNAAYPWVLSGNATIKPTGLDTTAPQIANMRLGFVQNVQTTRKWHVNNPSVQAGSGAPSTSTVTVASTRVGTVTWQGYVLDRRSPQSRMLWDQTPLYDGYESFDANGKSSIDNNDAPAALADKHTKQAQAVEGNQTWPVTVEYQWDKTVIQDDFLLWLSVADGADNLGLLPNPPSVVPIRQVDWKFHADSSASGLQKPTGGTDKAPDTVPVVTGQTANTLGKDASRYQWQDGNQNTNLHP
jgi:hypothetical protein